MGRRGKFITKRNKKRNYFRYKSSDVSDGDYVMEEVEESDNSEESSSAMEVSEESFDFGAISDSEKEDEVEKKVVRSKPQKGSSGFRKTRVKPSPKRTRVVDDDDDDDDEDFTPDGIDQLDEDEVERKVGRSKPQKGSSIGRKPRVKRLRKRTSFLDDEVDYDDTNDDEDFTLDGIDGLDEDEIEWNVGRSKPQKGSSIRRKTKVKRLRKRTRLLDDEVDYDDEDDDEEFTLDGVEFIDEEEELQVNNKKSNVSRRLMRKKPSIKGKKTQRKSNVLKNPLNKKRRTKSRRRGSNLKRLASSDDDFVIECKVMRKKNKKPGKREERSVVQSDSEFLSTGSSDFEYTISEEERELLREASDFCGSSKTLRVDRNLNSKKKKPLGEKGKEKVKDFHNDVGKQVCGICLSEEGKEMVRGTLNCCNHYFCFTCIMEWSKVESRCPLCKQRFVTISKPSRSSIGIGARNAVTRVPKRDQVYRPSEEEVRGYLDPYENVVCMECQRGGDDNLMLLCDICDSPAHTYCVGLGWEVPEGNWYCEGCRVSNPGSSNSLVQDELPPFRNLPSELPPFRSNIEGFDSSQNLPDRSFSQEFGVLPSPRNAIGENLTVTSPGASTLRGRRRIHRQVHEIFSNNRRNQVNELIGRNDGISHANVENDIFDSEVDQGKEITPQNASNPSCDRDNFTLSLSNWRRQTNQTASSTTANGSVHGSGTLHEEHVQNNQILGHEQHRQCSRSMDREGSRFLVVEGSKEQVQSMVKVHLKQLSRNINLEYKTFKDIARHSTHTILAACGLEHRPSIATSVQQPNCPHSEKESEVKNLMKDCCSSCFDSFVRVVVTGFVEKGCSHR